MVEDPDSAGERPPGDADGVERPSDGNRADPMGVVLRLPAGRGEPVGSTVDQLAAGRSETAAPTHWAGVATESPAGGTGTNRAADGSRPAHAAEPTERADWAWVEEWRAGNEPTPWATGLALAVFSALVVGVAVWVLAAGLSDRPAVAVLVNLLVAGGLAPAIWLSRGLPVLRWLGAGAAAGIVIGWIAAVLMLPLPAP